VKREPFLFIETPEGDGTTDSELDTELLEPKLTRLRTVVVALVVMSSTTGLIGSVIGEMTLRTIEFPKAFLAIK
jgi:hypothetical protein